MRTRAAPLPVQPVELPKSRPRRRGAANPQTYHRNSDMSIIKFGSCYEHQNTSTHYPPAGPAGAHARPVALRCSCGGCRSRLLSRSDPAATVRGDLGHGVSRTNIIGNRRNTEQSRCAHKLDNAVRGIVEALEGRRLLSASADG